METQKKKTHFRNRKKSRKTSRKIENFFIVSLTHYVAKKQDKEKERQNIEEGVKGEGCGVRYTLLFDHEMRMKHKKKHSKVVQYFL